MKKIEVRLRDSYRILIGAGLLKQAGHFLKEIGLAGKAVIITDPAVGKYYSAIVKQSLLENGFKAEILTVPEGEEQKSLETAGRLYEELSSHHAERTTPVLALGGGVIGDLAGFVAATYMRGTPFIQLPTTLLAQVDSSIGGKVAVNHGRLKNTIGAFYQPRLVISDIDTLRTLPAGQISDGLAEIIKYGIISDKELFHILEKNIDRIKSLDPGLLEEIVYRSAKIKAGVVEKDERDTGVRNILNYGHTVGHGIESASDFTIAHGEAVALGMIAAGRISNKMDILSEDELGSITRLINKAGLPTKLPALKIEAIMQSMKHDKKIQGGKIKFVLAKSIGEVFVTDEVSISSVEKVLVDFNEQA